jgi:DNA-binding transcriptional LysR family regulator
MLNEIDLSRADLNLLVLFEAVLGERHVGRAAGRLNLTASAVSHGLGRLRRLFNDPLFLRTPKGVVPTDRALELAEAVADILARSRNLIAGAAPFDAKKSTRRFTIGMPDGVAVVLLQPLLVAMRDAAPGIGISVRYIHRDTAVADLDARAIDVAIVPIDEVPARLEARTLYEDDLLLAVRNRHPFLKAPTLKHYCELDHLIVSLTGEPRAYVDDVLAARGLSRRVVLTVPNFMLALAAIAETDLVGTLPNRFLIYGPRFGVTGVASPLPMRSFAVRAIVSKVATMDAGVAWLLATIEKAAGVAKAKSGATRGEPKRRSGQASGELA